MDRYGSLSCFSIAQSSLKDETPAKNCLKLSPVKLKSKKAPETAKKDNNAAPGNNQKLNNNVVHPATVSHLDNDDVHTNDKIKQLIGKLESHMLTKPPPKRVLKTIKSQGELQQSTLPLCSNAQEAKSSPLPTSISASGLVSTTLTSQTATTNTTNEESNDSATSQKQQEVPSTTAHQVPTFRQDAKFRFNRPFLFEPRLQPNFPPVFCFGSPTTSTGMYAGTSSAAFTSGIPGMQSDDNPYNSNAYYAHQRFSTFAGNNHYRPQQSNPFFNFPNVAGFPNNMPFRATAFLITNPVRPETPGVVSSESSVLSLSRTPIKESWSSAALQDHRSNYLTKSFLKTIFGTRKVSYSDKKLKKSMKRCATNFLSTTMLVLSVFAGICFAYFISSFFSGYRIQLKKD